MRDEMVTIPQDEYDELIRQSKASKNLITFIKENSGETADYPIIITIDDDFVSDELIRRINKVLSAFKIEHNHIEP
jgi:hypothetical protein